MAWKVLEYVSLIIVFILGIRPFVKCLNKGGFYKKNSKFINIAFLLIIIIKVFFDITSTNEKHRLQGKVTTLESKTKNIKVLPSGRIDLGGLIVGAPIVLQEKITLMLKCEKEQDFDCALELIDEIDKMNQPNSLSIRPIFLKVIIYLKQGKVNIAMSELKSLKVEELDKKNIQLYYFLLGHCYLALKELGKSKLEFEEAVKSTSNEKISKDSKEIIDNIDRILNQIR